MSGGSWCTYVQRTYETGYLNFSSKYTHICILVANICMYDCLVHVRHTVYVRGHCSAAVFTHGRLCCVLGVPVSVCLWAYLGEEETEIRSLLPPVV